MDVQRRAWWMVSWSTIAITASVASLVLSPFSVLLGPISQEFGWSRSQTSGLVSIFALTAAVVTPVVGRLLDKHGTRKILVPGVILTLIGLASLSILPPQLWLWMTVMGLLGVVSVTVNGMPVVRLAARWVDRRRGLAIGIVGTGLALGQAISPVIVGGLMTHYGWRTSFIGLAVFGLIVALLPALFVLRDPRPEESVKLGETTHHTEEELPGLTVKEAFKTRQYWILLISTLVIACAMPGVLVHLVSILTDQGISMERAVAALSLAGLATMAGRLIGGFLLDVIHAPYVAMVVFLFPVVGFLMLGSGMGILPLIGAMCVGFAMGGEADLVSYMTSRYLGMKSFGSLYGILFALLALGYAIGPAVYAASYDSTGSYHTAYWIFGIALIVVMLALPFMGKYRFRPAVAVPGAHEPDPEDAPTTQNTGA
ncbi:MFS transporter [Ammonicoccus fulvus]|uniref:MFS transporter n=1 Tax=Ammonicoccus fulvus TaxID=3138240 RepID=A0ABZ3FR55_9ACTN